MTDRIGIWQENKAQINSLRVHNSKASFDINETGDLNDEEFHRMQGIMFPTEDQDDAGSNITDGSIPPSGRGGRRLQD